MIVIISGSINSGKSTLSKLLGKDISKSAIVEVDDLRNMISWMPIEEAVPLNLVNAVSVTKNFIDAGLNVIIPYPFSNDNYKYFVNNFNEVDIFAFTLAPNISVALANRGDRVLTNEEKDRIKYHYEIGIQKPSFGEIIDNSTMSASETSKCIIKKIDGKY